MANAPKVNPTDQAAASAVISEAGKISPSATPVQGEGTNAPAMAPGVATTTPQAGNHSNVTTTPDTPQAAQEQAQPQQSAGDFETDLRQFKEGFARYYDKLEAGQKHQVRQAFMEIMGGEAKEPATVAPTKMVESKAKDGTTISEEEQHEQYLKRYGPNYVVAQRPTAQGPGARTQQTVFSRNAWNRLPAKRDGSRDGWRQLVATPPEVKKLSSLKNKGGK